MKAGVVFLLLAFVAAGALRAQLPLPGQSDPSAFSPPVQVPAPGARIRQLQIQPGSGPVIIGPGGNITVPGASETNLAASAGFEPEAGRAGRPVEYRVTILGTQQAVDLPDPLPPPFGIELSPAGRTIGTQILNGALVTANVFRFSAVAARPGRYVMQGFEVTAGARRVRVPDAVFTATEPQPGEAAYQPLQVEIDVPNRDFFVGETIGARLLILETQDESPQYVAHVGKTTGSAVFRPSMRTRREQLVRQGRQVSGLVMPVQITPILEGEIELGCQVIVHVQKLDPFGQRNVFNTQTTLDAKPARVRVLALPRAGRLPGFTGAIGEFTVAQPRISATEIEAGEPLTLTVTMAGEGNLEGVAAPEIEEGRGWRAYRPTSEFQPDPSGENPARGMKTFTFTLVPDRAGQRSTPALPFCYFDPVKRAYVDISVPPVPVIVKASSAPAAAAPPENVTPEPVVPAAPLREVEPVMTGIEESPGSWTGSVGPALGARWFLALQAVPPALFIGLWAWRRRKEYLAAHPQILRRRRARGATRRALALARAAARRGDREEFLRASVGALREAAAPLDTARAGSLTREELLRILRDDATTSALAGTVLDSADAAKYSTGTGNGLEPAALLPELERAVRTLTRRCA